jgi:hypothetical protein
MNYETVNYAYLSGFLKSELYNLAYDEKFVKMKSYLERKQYIDKIVSEANTKAKEFEASVKAA